MAAEKPIQRTVSQRIIRAAFVTTAWGSALLVFGSGACATGGHKFNRPDQLLASGITHSLEGLMFLTLITGILLLWWNKPLQFCRSMWVGLVVLAFTVLSTMPPFSRY